MAVYECLNGHDLSNLSVSAKLAMQELPDYILIHKATRLVWGWGGGLLHTSSEKGIYEEMFSKTTSKNQFSDAGFKLGRWFIGVCLYALLAPSKTQIFRLFYGSVIYLKILNTL